MKYFFTALIALAIPVLYEIMMYSAIGPHPIMVHVCRWLAWAGFVSLIIGQIDHARKERVPTR